LPAEGFNHAAVVVIGHLEQNPALAAIIPQNHNAKNSAELQFGPTVKLLKPPGTPSDSEFAIASTQYEMFYSGGRFVPPKSPQKASTARDRLDHTACGMVDPIVSTP